MKTAAAIDLKRKIHEPTELGALAEAHRAAGRRIVHCHGCFDVVHPGHLRYLQFAREQGDVLVVSLTGDDAIEKADGTRPYVPQELRAEQLAAIAFVDHVVIADGATAEPIIAALRPDVYIKGKEYEGSGHPGFAAERALVESHGGRVLFSSGEVVFSSTALIDRIERAAGEDRQHQATRLRTSCQRWGVSADGLDRLIDEGFRGRRVLVVGDAMQDRYVFCDANNVASEAPVLSVRPLEEQTYLGGAAVIAAHLKTLGAEPHLVTAVGDDAASASMIEQLDALGVTHTCVRVRRALPVKLRYLVEAQKLLKVDHAGEQPLDSDGERRMLSPVAERRDALDGVIFADFGCGLISGTLLRKAVPLLREHVGTIAAGVSGPRKSLMALEHIDLLSLNERELRTITGDFECGLPTIAASIMAKLRLANLVLTLGPRGSVLFRPRESDPQHWFEGRLRSDYLPALSEHAVDTLGAGDAYLATATLTRIAGGALPHAGYLGSIAAALAIGQLGNQPIRAEQLRQRVAAGI